MNERKRLVHKVLYLLGVAVLLVPIAMLSAPGITDAAGNLVRGGTLARIRHDNKLSQANLGEIDPASETVKLATLGLRGVAVNILWNRAREFQKTENWTALSATCEQIRKLQPNFITVWEFQSWNLAYNVSVEFDDYRDRFRWVMRGIDFLKEGTRYNENEPKLLWYLAWIIGQKIGRADEHVQYRRLFKADDEFHGDTPLSQRDNWLVGQRWFKVAEEAVDVHGKPLRGKSPLIFYSDSAMCQMNYAETIEEEGTFGEVAKNAWKRANEMWTDFGNRDIATTYNLSIRLNDRERHEAAAKKSMDEMMALVPEGLPEKMHEERVAKLSPREQAALNTPPDKRTAEQFEMMYAIDEKVKVNASDIANRLEGEDRVKALQLAEAARESENLAGIVDRYREIVNFDYWRLRAEMERTENAEAARRAIYQANQDFEQARIAESVKLFEEGFAKWRAVFDEFPQLLGENTITEDLADNIKTYIRNLEQLERKLPDDFILRDVLEKEQERLGEPPPVEQTEASEEKLRELGVPDAGDVQKP
jgi:hypothetical protein